jgi:hypothetical protein
MRTLALALGALLCAGRILAADLQPASIIVGDERIRSASIGSIRHVVINLKTSTNGLEGSWKIVGVIFKAYQATNGILDVAYLNSTIRILTDQSLKIDPNLFFTIATGFLGEKLEPVYGEMNSGKYQLVKSDAGDYVLPSVATNIVPTEGQYCPIFAGSLVRAKVEAYYGEFLINTLDTAVTEGFLDASKGAFYCPRWLLANDYSGTITLYTGSGASATETKYDLKTGLKWVGGMPPLWLGPPRRTANGTEIVVTGKPGARVVVECSTDLKTWMPATTLSNPTGTFTFIESADHLCRYHRARYELLTQ